MKKSKKATIKIYLFYGWLAIVVVLSTYNLHTVKVSNISDKTIHFVVYFLTALTSYIYFSDFIKNKKLLSIAAVLFSCAYGTIMEFMQYFVPSKSFSTDEIIANCVGALVLGIIVMPKKSLTINGRKI